MHMMICIKFLLFISTCLTIDAQLSIDELSSIHSKYSSIGMCNDFQYEFPYFRINYHHYNQILLDCSSSSIIFRNTERESSSLCLNDENYLENFRIYFSHRSFSSIHVNQFFLHGIELASLDDFIQKTYIEYAYHRSQWALLIHFENEDKQQSYDLAIVTNDEMTFILFLTSSLSMKTSIKIIFPYGNSFLFNQSFIDIWRIDHGVVLIPNSLKETMVYQLSKFEFRLYDNETFYIYGTESLITRRLTVRIDETYATCIFNRLFQCKFPILPLEIHDSHRPFLQLIYGQRQIFNATLTLNPRIRLNQIPTNHRLANISSYKINLNTNLCKNHSYQSEFILIIHLSTKYMNGTKQYEKIVKDDIPPIDCNATADIGQQIENVTKSVPQKSITALNVDLIHQWFGHPNCRSEKTRITFN